MNEDCVDARCPLSITRLLAFSTAFTVAPGRTSSALQQGIVSS
jgi:hypothetical protein